MKTFDHFLDQSSKWGIVFCVFVMLILTVMNIVLRWFEVSIHWVEPAVRHLVFIAAFLGGSLATGARHHIKIDIISRLLEKKKNAQKYIDQIVTILTLVATILLTYSSTNLVKVEFEFGKEVFLNIHSGYLISIIPFGMGLISIRLLLRFLMSFGVQEGSEA
ncbi:MAG: TRAP-type C4-dicarboxylate transport system permease small subunit [Bacteriovoracaceae bacterium]|jgi:TRAP-type C4-dicarboxylate transport system permease small subunit